MKYLKQTLAVVALTSAVSLPVLADTTTTTTTTSGGNVILRPIGQTGRFFGNIITAPLRVFRATDRVAASPAGTVTVIGSQPVIIQIDRAGQPTLLKEVVAVAPVVSTEVTTVTTITSPMHDDLLNRRNDLVARVAVEQARGQLSSGEASAFLARIENLDASRVVLRRNEAAGAYIENERACDALSYHEQVSKIYDGYDKVASDMQDESRQGDRQLAATYSYIAL